MPRLTMKDKLHNLEQTALACVQYVGFASYREREATACRAVRRSARTGKYVDPDNMEDDNETGC